MAIPFGETRTYGEIARQMGSPAASRAVGAANGRNPIAIIAPCHRVIGSTGKLTGFAGGLEREGAPARHRRARSETARTVMSRREPVALGDAVVLSGSQDTKNGIPAHAGMG